MSATRPWSRSVTAAVLLGLVAIVLVAFGVWLLSEADRLSDEAEAATEDARRFGERARELTGGVDRDNVALLDPAATAQVTRELRTAIEAVFSYDYRHLDRTARAVDTYVTGQARCAYDEVFGTVLKTATEQRATLTSRVHEIGVIRLSGDGAAATAEVLVLLDQTSTRSGSPLVSGTQFGITGQRHDGRWLISEIDLFDAQPSGGEPTDC